MLRDLFAFAIMACVIACSASILTPPTGPGTEYPCGVNGHQCSGGGCCSNSSTCCDGTTCTAGYCEYIGGDMRAPDAGRGPLLVPQWSPR